VIPSVRLLVVVLVVVDPMHEIIGNSKFPKPNRLLSRFFFKKKKKKREKKEKEKEKLSPILFIY
jgi:hypothetical protein